MNFVNLMSSTCSSFYWLSSPLVGRSSVVKDSAQVLIIYRRLADEVPNVLSTAGTVMPMTAPLTMISSIVRYRVARVSFSPLDCVRSWIGTGAGTNECLDRTLTPLHCAITPLINEITSSLAGGLLLLANEVRKRLVRGWIYCWCYELRCCLRCGNGKVT